ncbi:UPF0481 protein At3g47200-like [Tasmannia lanceolata]|uniref:UPF0481 protein At3g47200-like n=1 Tax=Tasmannia lanceolata TaxID=3420 RepID=UPI0040639921
MSDRSWIIDFPNSSEDEEEEMNNPSEEEEEMKNPSEEEAEMNNPSEEEEEMKNPSEEEEEEMKNRHSIFRVLTSITSLNEKAYMPKTVSLGPYHQGEPHLQPMEKHKKRALDHFRKTYGKSLEDYSKALEDVVPQLMDSYDHLDEKWKNNREQFLTLMIIDGCFLLKILFENMERSKDPTHFNFDPQLVIYIRRDILMLENQLPLLVLVKLLLVQSAKGEDDVIRCINELVIKFYDGDTSTNDLIGLNSLHVLDVLRKSMILGPSQRPFYQAYDNMMEEGRSAMQLRRARIKFKRNPWNYIDDIVFFERTNVLSLPELIMNELTEIRFLNLMALERMGKCMGSEVTSYVTFMYGLIKSEEDASLLQSKGIIKSADGNDKAIVDGIKELARDMYLNPYSNMCLKQYHLNRYYLMRKRWSQFQEWHTIMKRHCFKITLALISAVVLWFLNVNVKVYHI